METSIIMTHATTEALLQSNVHTAVAEIVATFVLLKIVVNSGNPVVHGQMTVVAQSTVVHAEPIKLVIMVSA
jgi:trimethylamine:corrinoid methyltransferase-like protein